MEKLIINGTTYVPESEISSANEEGLVYCIVRTYSAGVWAGYIDPTKMTLGNSVKNARRLWKWNSQFTLSELAILGVNKSSDCKFAIEVPIIYLSEVIEVIPCTEIGKKTLIEQAVYIP